MQQLDLFAPALALGVTCMHLHPLFTGCPQCRAMADRLTAGAKAKQATGEYGPDYGKKGGKK